MNAARLIHLRTSALVGILLAVATSACVYRSPGKRLDTPTEPLSAQQSELRDELRRDVEHLSAGIGPRHAAYTLDSLVAAENWILDQLRQAGVEPLRDELDVNGLKVANVEATFPGTSRPDEIVLLGAHYDSVARSPGANDNASGVAVLLAMARRLAEQPTGRTVRLVFFVNEESPFTGGIHMGSRRYAKRCRARGDDIVLMLNVDSVGAYSDEKGSQKFPPVIRRQFPSRANFVLFATDRANRKQLDRVVALYQQQCDFPSVGAATDSREINRSDHASFLWVGYPAIAVTDTTEFRDPTYHLPTDTADHLNYDQLARMTDGLLRTVRALAGGQV